MILLPPPSLFNIDPGEKDLIYSVEAMWQPLQVANNRRLYSQPSPSPGSRWNQWSGWREKKKLETKKKKKIREKGRTLLIKRITMENEKGRGKASVKREAFIVRGAQCINPILLRAAILSVFKNNL